MNSIINTARQPKSEQSMGTGPDRAGLLSKSLEAFKGAFVGMKESLLDAKADMKDAIGSLLDLTSPKSILQTAPVRSFEPDSRY